MQMKRSCASFLAGVWALSLFFPLTLPAKTSIAVYQVKVKGKADPSLGPAMTSLMIYELSKSPELQVIEEETLKLVFERQGLNLSELCDSTQCQVEIGKLVQAQKMVVGELLRMGETYIMTLRITNIATGTVEASIKKECTCTEDQLPLLASQAAIEIRKFYGESGLSAPPLPTPSVPAGQPSAPASAPQDYWAIYKEGVAAYERKDADTALLKFAAAEPSGRQDWKFMNDLYWYWGATYRDLKKDNVKALEYYQKCVQVSQDLNDWPAYWAIYMQGVIANERGDAAAAMQKLNQAEQYGKNEPGFGQEVRRMKDVIQKPH